MKRLLAAGMILCLLLTGTPFATAGPAPVAGSVVLVDVQDGTGRFRNLPLGTIVTRAVAAEGLAPVDFGALELSGQYATSPVTKLNEPTPKALEEAAGPAGAQFALLIVLRDYSYDEKTGVSSLEGNVEVLRREGPEGPFKSQASIVRTADSPRRATSTYDERTAQRQALDRLARDAAQWLRTGTSKPGRPVQRPERKKMSIMIYALGAVGLLVAMSAFKGKKGGGGTVSGDVKPPNPVLATPSAPGETTLTWQKPADPTGGLTLEGYEVWVSLTPGGDRFVARYGANVTTAVVHEGLAEGGVTRAEFRIRSVAKQADNTEVVSAWAYFPPLVFTP